MRRFLPREHGLIAWVGLPLLAALALAPGWSTAAAVGAVLAGFGAFNAWRREQRRAAGLALLVAAAAGALALSLSDRPALLAAALGLGAAGALGGARFLHGSIPRLPGLESGAILALNALGATLAVAGGARAGHAITLALVLAAWQVAGLWWVRRSLAAVLPRRHAWGAGLGVALGLAGAALAAGSWYGLLAVPAVLLLYPLRVLAHRAPESPRQAARVGLTELGWSVLAIIVAVAAA